MDFSKYIQPMIANRVKSKREELGIRQEDFFTMENTIQRGVISAIERNKVYGKNSSFIPDKTLDVIAHVLDLSRAEVIYGNEDERVQIVRWIFYKVAYNLNIPDFYHWNNKIYYDKELTTVSNQLHEAMFFYGRFAYYWSKEETINISFDKEFDPFCFEGAEKIYDELVTYVWELVKEDCISSFEYLFIKNDSAVTMRNLDKQIVKWVRTDIKRFFEELQSTFKKSELFNIGFRVRMLMKQSRESAGERLQGNRTYINYLNDDSNIQSLTSRELLGKFEEETKQLLLNFFSGKPTQQDKHAVDGVDEEQLKTEKTSELLVKMLSMEDDYDRRKIKSPDLLSEQQQIMQNEISEAYEKSAYEMMEVQEKHFELMSNIRSEDNFEDKGE